VPVADERYDLMTPRLRREPSIPLEVVPASFFERRFFSNFRVADQSLHNDHRA
jgi:hypothetical protein